MAERVWDRFLTEQDKAHIAVSRPKSDYGFGAKAAILSIDNYRAAVGDQPEPLLSSAALGLGGPDIEADIRAVYQAPTTAFWSLTKPPTQASGPGEGWLSWEAEQFCRQALEAEPVCLELLWSAHPVWASEAGYELLDLRGAFLSQLLAPAYSAHALARFKELDEAEPEQSERRWARAAYLLHLLMDGAALLRAGDTTDAVGEHRERLIGLRTGQETWDAVDAWRLELQRDLEEASAATFLPPRPDIDRVNAWLAHTRRREVDRAS